MTLHSQLPIAALTGTCCLVTDADAPVGAALVDEVVAAGATAIALRHRPPSRHMVSWRSAVVAQTISVPADLREAAAVRSGLTWAIERCGRLDLAIITDTHGVGAMTALAECALTDLALTARFSPGPLSRLVCLARPESNAALERHLAARTVPFADLVEVRLVDSWPDTPLSSLAAVRASLHATGTPSGARSDISD